MAMNAFLYDVLAALFSFVVGIFFREIRARGSQHIPKTGPVIFVAAPHHNQFVDPLMLIRTARRRVGFLSAQKSMDRRYVGTFIKALGAIGVTRAIDIAVKLPARIWLPDPANAPDLLEAVVGSGVDVDFEHWAKLGKIAPGHSLLLVIPPAAGASGPGTDVTLEIAAVEGATRLRLRRAVTDTDVVTALSLPTGLAARVAPKVDYAQMYEAVYDRLHSGECIGIFPEGGSHDRSELLPFKAGAAIMALGAMEKYADLDVKLVPVGLSYFHAHRFRSRAVVEYGAPISVPREWVDMYRAGGADKRAACKNVLDLVQAAVANVTVTAPDYATLQVIQAVRRLYRPLNRKLTLVQKLELTRRLMRGYLHYKSDPRVKDLEQKVLYYNQLLRYHGLQDHQVERTAIGGMRALGLLMYRLALLTLMGLVALPGTILNAPIAVAASRISKRKAKEALAASTVKIEGRDVLATWKLLVALGLVPLVHILYTLLTWVVVRFVVQWPAPWTWFVPLFELTALPYLSLVAVSWGETGADIYKSLAPLLYSVLPTRWTSSHNLRQVRRQLERDLNDVVNDLGPTLFPDFKTFFLKDTEIPAAQQSAAGLQRVSSWVTSWFVQPAGAAAAAVSSSRSGLHLATSAVVARAANLVMAATSSASTSPSAETDQLDLTPFFVSAPHSHAASPTSTGVASPRSPTGVGSPRTSPASPTPARRAPVKDVGDESSDEDDGLVVVKAADVMKQAAATVAAPPPSSPPAPVAAAVVANGVPAAVVADAPEPREAAV
ncbi:hypothetical protein GGF32_009167 [Allomyces javanicus]|nr:hypothetical protein GGF32_009167 [Allomyces javanicus]